ncbi:hypothetical protein [Cognatiluteimonas telluris]|jgi:hypothetical protein|uniref:hypothetical protein n=1 Tax=Cognatiluteimonas telluris TaxID=1104775 RepID=UPI00140C16DB|nr:hypothetical protein [Lysobacter telluris]
MVERGVIELINTRGRLTLRLADRVVFADLNNGSGGCVGDMIEGDMRPGVQSWRNVGNGMFSVVRIVAVHPAVHGHATREAHEAVLPGNAADQNGRRKLS